jgi:Spy/CpxP family protein refolding chaperone
MRKFQVIFGGAALALSMISTTSLPMAAYGQAGTGEPGTAKPRMHRMLGVEAPWISIALKHQKELSLSSDQVANLEKIRTLYRDQSTPIQEQLRATESEITGVLQETPANLIQAKLKIEQAEKFRSQLRYLRAEALENGKSVLTAPQRDQLKSLFSAGHPGFKKPQQGQAS